MTLVDASPRTGAHLLGEVVATFGLVLVVFGVVRSGRASAAPFAVAAYIAGRVLVHQLDQLRQSRGHRSRARCRTRSPASRRAPRPASSSRNSSAVRSGSRASSPCIRASRPRPPTSCVPHAATRRTALTVTAAPEVLFVCVHNAGRSQMAAALLDHHAQGRVHVRSAGSEPADRINPAVVDAIAEMGHRCHAGVPEAADRRGRARGRRDRHDGLRRRVPRLPGQALPRLAARRPRRSGDRRRARASATRSTSASARCIAELAPS